MYSMETGTQTTTIQMPPAKECGVCLEKVTGSLRKEVICQYCQYPACLVCVKRYMLSTPEDPHCMSCKRAWNRDFIDSYMTMAFRKGSLKTHREGILVDREKARLPLLQPRVDAKVRADQMNQPIRGALAQIQDMERTILAARQEVYRMQRRQGRLFEIADGRAPVGTEDGGQEKKDVRQFIQKCPVDDCRGFLSTQWKCGTCQTYVCNECIVPKGKDRDSPHTCDEATKATAALIQKETRPCPKCGMGISKVDGCDQMWCVSCQTPFSWTTGRMVFGVVHNPHYYQWMRDQNNGEAPRVAGDVPCGGLINMNSQLRSVEVKYRKEIQAIHRLAGELLDQHLRQYARLDEVPDNGDLGIAYTLNHITMDEWKKKLWQRETKREKSLDIRGPLDLFANVCSEILRRMGTPPAPPPNEFIDLLQQLRTLRHYVNSELTKIGVRYGCMTPAITVGWKWDLYGNNRGSVTDTRNNIDKLIVLSNDVLTRFNQVELGDFYRNILSQCMQVEDSNGFQQYVIEAWLLNGTGLSIPNRNLLRLAFGEPLLPVPGAPLPRVPVPTAVV